MERLQLILGTVNSQPYGESASVIEHCYQHSYRPALKSFYRCPQLKFTLFYSGLLLEWLDRNHSEFLSALSEMYEHRTLELLIGGFADPAFPLIPRPDRLGQLEFSSTLIRRIFGKRIRGAAMGTDFWDQEIVSSFHAAGIDYLFLDDYHFEKAGLPQMELYHPAMTDDQGKPILIFPVSNRLSRRCWHVAPQDVVDELDRLAGLYPGEVFTLLFQGEVPEQGGGIPASEPWLDTFLEGVQRLQEQGRILTVHPGRYIKKPKSRPHLYFPPTQNREMVFWHADPELRKAFNSAKSGIQKGPGVHGYFHAGTIRQQMSRYVESGLLYSKMQYVHTMVTQIRGDRYRKEAGREELLRAQSHEVYWHGTSGGIYRHELRRAAYGALLRAERHAREKGIFSPSLSVADFDMDGMEEVLYQGVELNAYVHTRGASLFELDYMQAPVNYLDTMSRYPEHYHDAEIRSEGSDSLPRWSFMDCFLPSSKNQVSPRSRRENLICLGDHIYTVEEIRKDSRTVRFLLETELKQGSHTCPVRIYKTYTFNKSMVYVGYQIQNVGSTVFDFIFCPEINLALTVPGEDRIRMFRREGRNAGDWSMDDEDVPECQEIYFEDPQNRSVIHCQLSEAAAWWNVPVSTVFRSGGVLKTRVQCNALYPRWHLVLEPGFSRDLDISLSVVRMRGASLIN